jgi:hypothetical protein
LPVTDWIAPKLCGFSGQTVRREADRLGTAGVCLG